MSSQAARQIGFSLDAVAATHGSASLLARADAADLATRVELTDQVDLDTYDGLQRMGMVMLPALAALAL